MDPPYGGSVVTTVTTTSNMPVYLLKYFVFINQRINLHPTAQPSPDALIFQYYTSLFSIFSSSSWNEDLVWFRWRNITKTVQTWYVRQNQTKSHRGALRAPYQLGFWTSRRMHLLWDIP